MQNLQVSAVVVGNARLYRQLCVGTSPEGQLLLQLGLPGAMHLPSPPGTQPPSLTPPWTPHYGKGNRLSSHLRPLRGMEDSKITWNRVGQIGRVGGSGSILETGERVTMATSFLALSSLSPGPDFLSAEHEAQASSISSGRTKQVSVDLQHWAKMSIQCSGPRLGRNPALPFWGLGPNTIWFFRRN